MNNYYAGVGSRQTPSDMLETMKLISQYLEQKNYILRSGGASGADKAFEAGVFNNKEIFYANDANRDAERIAALYHPAWDRCSSYAKALHARNAFQILGRDLKTPVEFVVCWTPDGAETHAQRKYETGGTGTAISIANKLGIRVYNLVNTQSLTDFRTLVRTFR